MKKPDLCLMVKNEEKYIERCIKSVKDYVDNIIIMDTGSTDNTISIAKKYATFFFEREFDGNFSHMRQYVLDMSKNEWILFLDADECFEKSEIESLVKFMNICDFDDEVGGIRLYRYNFFSTGGWYTDQSVKLYRNNMGFKYDKIVTEKIESSILMNGKKILDVDCILNHTGHCKSRVSRDKKTEMYIKLLKKQLSSNQYDGLIYSYIGINYGNIGDFKNAEAYCKKGVAYSTDNTVCHVFMGNIYRAINKIDCAIKEYKEAIRISEGNARIRNLLGLCYMSVGRIKEAKETFDLAYKEDKSLVHILLNKGLADYYLQNYNDALSAWNQVLDRNPFFLYQEENGVVECNIFDRASYETIHNYMGLRYYYIDASIKTEKVINIERFNSYI